MKNLIDFEKKYKRQRIFSFVLVLLLGLTIYKNLDYYVFKYLISYNYIYTKSLDAIYDQALGKGNYNGYAQNFDEVVMSVFTEKLQSIGNDRYTYLYNPKQYTLSKENTKKEAGYAKIEPIDKDSALILIPNISKYTYKFMKENIDELQKYKNVIIDLRENYGGQLDYLYKIEEFFLEKGNSLGYETSRLPIFTKHVVSNQPQQLHFDNIIILQSDKTASAAEGFIIALRENSNNVTTIGTKTFGKGIGQIVLPLLSGYAIKATVLTIETPNHGSIHKIGISPDIEYTKNDIVDYAKTLIPHQK